MAASGISSFTTLLESLSEEHELALLAVRSGEERPPMERMRNLTNTLLAEHERKIAAAEAEAIAEVSNDDDRPKRSRAKKPTMLNWAGHGVKYMWQLGDPDLPKKGGPEHRALEELAEECRTANNGIEEQSTGIKAEIKVHEKQLLEAMAALSDASFDKDTQQLRSKVSNMMRAMEKGDSKLANLRFEEILNVEQIRVAKVNIWRFVNMDMVNAKLTEVDVVMRSEDDWWNSPQCADVTNLISELKSEYAAFDAEVAGSRVRSDRITAEIQDIEACLAKGQDDVWSFDGDEREGLLKLMKATFELQAQSWKRTHLRDKQLCIQTDVWKIRLAMTMLRRHADVQKAVLSGDLAAMISYCAKVDSLSQGIHGRASKSKELIVQILDQAREAREKLKSMKHVQNAESDATRDALLVLIYNVAIEDIRLEWLRKEQLQAIELSGLLRKAIPAIDEKTHPMAAMVAGRPLSPEVKSMIVSQFERTDSSRSGQIDLQRVAKTLQRLDPSLSNDMVRSLLADVVGKTDGSISYEDFVDSLYSDPPPQ